MDKIGDHCVVLGGSVGGLLAARVLSDAFDRVTVVERDRLPHDEENRRGVPQGRHAHALLPAGAAVLDDLFPGLLDDFEARGAPVVRQAAEMHFAPGGHLLSQNARYAPTYQPSRPQLEGLVRARVRALPNVEVVDQCEAVDLISTSGADRRVTGVRVLRKAHHAEEPLAADLVVDATGRTGRSTVLLPQLGYEPPQEQRLEVDIKYVSRSFRLPPGRIAPTKVVIVGARPGRPTGLTFLEHAADRWMLTLIGYGGHHPPTDPDAFLEFAGRLLPPAVLAAVREAEPLDQPVAHRFPASTRRRYEWLSRFPAGLLVFGDAICSFNPVYGQGMSAAALQATALRDSLARGADGLAGRFFKSAGRRIEVAWHMAVGGDLALPEVQGPRPARTKVINAYLERVLTLAETDPVVAERFARVSSLLAPPTLLLSPAVAGRVLFSALRRPPRATDVTEPRAPLLK